MNFKSTIPIFLVSAILIFIFWNCKKGSATIDPAIPSTTVTDIDGNVYHTITIGTQVWMVENLKTTKYRNGDQIPNVTANASWAALTSGAYCWNNNDAANKVTYGGLYNWFAVVDSRSIAPADWHVPTDAEWTTLTTYLGGDEGAGGPLKETGTSHWITPNNGATNSTGFTALPGGLRNFYDGTFNTVGYNGYWWSCTALDASNAGRRSINVNSVYAILSYASKQHGLSVRCIRD